MHGCLFSLNTLEGMKSMKSTSHCVRFESMAWKYNMSINEFNNFSTAVYEAMSVPAPEWTYHNAIDFVLQAVTTIGEIRSYIICSNCCGSRFEGLGNEAKDIRFLIKCVTNCSKNRFPSLPIYSI